MILQTAKDYFVARNDGDQYFCQLEMISELYSDIKEFKGLNDEFDVLGKMMNKFIQSIEKR